MKRLDEFRIYYNHTVHPELMRMEQRRRSLLWLFFISFILLVGLIIFELYINILVITLLAIIPISLYITWLVYQAQQFRQKFKPNVVRLILDFLDDSMNYGELSYDGKRTLTKSQFLSSQIFPTSAPIYQGEDYISGIIGNMSFELSEILVQDFSKVNQKLKTIFKGIFLHSRFTFPLQGNILILPRDQRQYLSRSIRAFMQSGGKNIDDRMYDARYMERFMTYATHNADVSNLLSIEMQQLIVDYCIRSQKQVYISFVGANINIFLVEEDDFLEPYLFRPNVSFELVEDFFEDIQLVIAMIEDFDRYY